MAKATATKPQTANVVYRGKREELQGRKFQIPAGLRNPARFIEEEHDRQQAEAAAKAEQERQAEPQRQAAAQAAAEAEAEALADVPEPVDPAPVETTDSPQERMRLWKYSRFSSTRRDGSAGACFC